MKTTRSSASVSYLDGFGLGHMPGVNLHVANGRLLMDTAHEQHCQSRSDNHDEPHHFPRWWTLSGHFLMLGESSEMQSD
jgi:hypothetical protein